MKSIIKNILLEEVVKKSNYLKINDSKFGAAIRRHLEKDVTWGDIDHEMVELAEKYAIPVEYIKFITFKYIVDGMDDPKNEMGVGDWLYNIPNKIDFLKDSGYYDEFININKFSDIEMAGKGKYVFVVSGWYEFSDLFDDFYLAEQVLSEDWAELYDVWGADLEEIFNTLNDSGIKLIQDFIIENVSEIYNIGHREEFNEEGMGMTGEVGTDVEGIINVASNVENIRQITDNYNLYLLVDEGEFEEKENLISGLRSAYNNSYNGITEDEIFDQMKNEIEDYIGSEGKWVGEVLHFPVTQQINNMVEMYIEEINDDPIAEHGSLLDMLSWLARNHRQTISTPNLDYYYPDHNKLENWFNEVLGDYIY